MNIATRLTFVFLGIIAVVVFGRGILSSSDLSLGQSLVLWSVLAAGFGLFTTAFYTRQNRNEVIAIVLMFFGIFFGMLCFGMYKQTDELAYGAFTWISIMLCGTSAVMLVFCPTKPLTAEYR